MRKRTDDDDVVKASRERVAGFCTAMAQLMALRIEDEIKQVEEDRRQARTRRREKAEVQP